MLRIPVKSDETRGEKFVTELVFAGCGEGVMQEESVADGTVDYAVEDVREEFSLVDC